MTWIGQLLARSLLPKSVRYARSRQSPIPTRSRWPTAILLTAQQGSSYLTSRSTSVTVSSHIQFGGEMSTVSDVATKIRFATAATAIAAAAALAPGAIANASPAAPLPDGRAGVDSWRRHRRTMYPARNAFAPLPGGSSTSRFSFPPVVLARQPSQPEFSARLRHPLPCHRGFRSLLSGSRCSCRSLHRRIYWPRSRLLVSSDATGQLENSECLTFREAHSGVRQTATMTILQ